MSQPGREALNFHDLSSTHRKNPKQTNTNINSTLSLGRNFPLFPIPNPNLTSLAPSPTATPATTVSDSNYCNDEASSYTPYNPPFSFHA
jgi:hypothetical protein